jgi:hypothetical protein
LQVTSLHTIAIGPQHYAIKIKNLEKVASREKRKNHDLLGRRAKKNLVGKWGYSILLATT